MYESNNNSINKEDCCDNFWLIQGLPQCKISVKLTDKIIRKIFIIPFLKITSSSFNPLSLVMKSEATYNVSIFPSSHDLLSLYKAVFASIYTIITGIIITWSISWKGHPLLIHNSSLQGLILNTWCRLFAQGLYAEWLATLLILFFRCHWSSVT